MLGLGLALAQGHRSLYLSFAERGLARPFLDRLSRCGLENRELRHNFPRLGAAIEEVAEHLREADADILFCHGYKADLIGWRAARRVGIPVAAVSRGWTAATWKVRCYEWVDRFCLFAMDAVVCVSEGQAAKVRNVGVPAQRVRVIRNALDMTRFAQVDAAARGELESLFADKPRTIVAAAGRFSPEKGFPVLVDVARKICQAHPETGFVLFGDGPQRSLLAQKIQAAGLAGRIVLPGFRDDLDRLLPAVDVVALPSYTEGLPNIALEACAGGVPVVATAVGGTPEIVADGDNGFLVPAGQVEPLAAKLAFLLDSASCRERMGRRGKNKVFTDFSFATQARDYEFLARELVRKFKVRRGLRRQCVTQTGPAFQRSVWVDPNFSSPYDSARLVMDSRMEQFGGSPGASSANAAALPASRHN